MHMPLDMYIKITLEYIRPVQNWDGYRSVSIARLMLVVVMLLLLQYKTEMKKHILPGCNLAMSWFDDVA